MMWSQKVRRRFVAVLIAGVLLLVSVQAAAEATVRNSDEVSRITRQVSQEVYSPYCPGQTLAMCPSSNASVARQEIQAMAQEGLHADEIKQVLVERYGDQYEMHEPPRRDQMTLLGGIIFGLFIAGLAVRYLARRSRDDDDGPDLGEQEWTAKEIEDDPLLLEELRTEYRD